MTTRTKWGLTVLALAVCVAMIGCGKKEATGGDTGSSTAATPAPADTAKAADTTKAAATPAADMNMDFAALDAEAPAGSANIDAAKAAKGKALFTSKTCVACHAFGKKLIGPDLAPVASQRSAKWMKTQMMHPDIMTAKDPASMKLLAEYKTQMVVPGGVTDEEAEALVEYVRSGGK
jgi:cytochrome c551/c552